MKIENQDTKLELHALAKRAACLISAINSLKEDYKSIAADVKKIGVSPSEFAKVVKYLTNTEILYKEMALLETIESLVDIEEIVL